MHKCENIERKITINILREIREDIMSLKCEQDAIIKGPLRKNPQKYLQPTNPTVLFSFGGGPLCNGLKQQPPQWCMQPIACISFLMGPWEQAFPVDIHA